MEVFILGYLVLEDIEHSLIHILMIVSVKDIVYRILTIPQDAVSHCVLLHIITERLMNINKFK